jgi:hypothetical protein
MARALLLRSGAALALCGAALGCQSSTAAPPYTPYQGITIDSAALVAPYGCGMGPTQVYRYVATVAYAPGPANVFGAASLAPLPESFIDAASGFHQIGLFTFGGPQPVLASGTFDCFADAVFEGLPAPPGTFVLTVYAFTYAEGVEAGLACDSAPCVPPVIDAGTVISGFSWTTTCTATEEAADSVVAQCDPLHTPADAGADAAAQMPGSDAGTVDAATVDAATVDAAAVDAEISDASRSEGGG